MSEHPPHGSGTRTLSDPGVILASEPTPTASPADRGPPATPAALEAAGVCHAFHSGVALDRVTIRVPLGETLALVGESGSGKTTLLRTFNALIRPDAGTVYVNGENVAEVDAVRLRRSVGYVPQNGGLLPHWTVARNAALVPELLDLDDADDRGTAALARVGLDPDRFGQRYPRSLSGGERQRVALARALAAGPSVVLLDEPFGALDALTRGELTEVFRDALGAESVSALLVTHDLRVAFALADRVCVLREGRIVQVGTAAELTGSPAEPYVAALLGRAGVA